MTGRANPKQYAYENSNFNKLQNEVDEVRDVMKNNIEQILKRGENLDELADKSSNLENSAVQFSITSKKVRRKYWWQNMKMTLILIAVVLIVIAAIAIGLALKYAPAKTPPQPDSTTSTSSTTSKLIFNLSM